MTPQLEPALSERRFDHLTMQDREHLTMLEHRALQLADWIERDRNEPDKVIAYAQDLRRTTWIANGMRRG